MRLSRGLRGLGFGLWLTLFLAVVVLPPKPSRAEERTAPHDMVDRLTATALPGRDPFDLAARLRGLSLPISPPAPVAAAPLSPGLRETFWILNQPTAQLFQADAGLRLVTPHAYWFVEADMDNRALQADLEQSASVFETRTYPTIHRYFGAEPSPGIDGASHVVFLLANVPGVAAYFSSADAYPRSINPRSNEHEMIYVNLNVLNPGQPAFDSTLTHEFQHMVHFNQCPNQEGWVDEGASELAMRVNGYPGPAPAAFAARPDVQLNTWGSQPSDVERHYEAAYLFLRYVAERAGGWDALPRLLASCARGEGLFSSFLAQDPLAPNFDSLFADWAVANLVQDPTVVDGRYAYDEGAFHVALSGAAATEAPFLGSVSQYAANYVELPTGPGSATFSGDGLVPLLSASMDDGGAWWSNRGDSLDSRLTRRVDLRNVSEATLRFKAWYDLENQFDFVYLSASRDGGATWQVLPGTRTSSDAATGNNYGPGWTGSTGSDWLDEQVDLTPMAGTDALLRFEYVTDQSYNGQGFALKDVAIPQLDLSEPGAAEAPWAAEGWVRVDAPIPEHWNLRLVRWSANATTVDAVPVGADGSATFALDPGATRSVLVVAPSAPRTILPASYSVAVRP